MVVLSCFNFSKPLRRLQRFRESWYKFLASFGTLGQRANSRGFNSSRATVLDSRLLQYFAMNNLTAVVTQLEQERNRLSSELNGIDQAIQALRGLAGRSSPPRSGGGISAAGRARIASAARARWAKIRASKPGSQTNPAPKRTMSAAARRKIAASQRARWARVKRKK